MLMNRMLRGSLLSSFRRLKSISLLSSLSSLSSLALIDLNEYIDKHRSTLKPPVANKLMFDSPRLKIMIVGGPNQRDDYHIEKGEELFVQLQGYMDLDIMDNNKFKRIRISEGEIFVLPPCIPHSPQRYANSIGLVFERVRYQGENDALRWYIPNTNKILYEDVFSCTDLGTQLKPIIERYQSSIENTTKMPSKDIKQSMEFERDSKLQKFNLPFVLNERIDKCSTNHNLINSYEYVVDVWNGSSSLINITNGDIFLWQSSGQSEITISGNKESFNLKEGQVTVVSASKLSELLIKQSKSSDKLITIYNKATK